MVRFDQEFEGKNLEEALHAAAEALGIAEPELDYKILEQGRRGLFGLGAKAVRIRVMPPVGTAPEPPPGPAEEPAREAGEARQATADDGGVESTVRQIFELMGFELSVSTRSMDGGIGVELGGADRKLLLQKDGELIAALQFLLNRMARRAWPGVGRIQLSCDGDRKRRDQDLLEQAREIARQVVQSGKTRRLHPMNAYERRLVHIAVREFPELDSRSEGNGFLKRVRVFRRK